MFFFDKSDNLQCDLKDVTHELPEVSQQADHLAMFEHVSKKTGPYRKGLIVLNKGQGSVA